MEENPTRICELSVCLGDVDVVGVEDEALGPLVIAYPDAVPAGVWGLWRAGVAQGHHCGAAGGFADLWACGAVGVA